MPAIRSHPRLVSLAEGNGVLRDNPRLGFDPRNVSAPLIAWVRGDLGITLNSGDVSAWADQSGEDNTFSQGTASKQPEFLARSHGGRASVYFEDGNAHNLVSTINPYTTFSAGDEWTVVVVGGNWDSDATSSNYYEGDGLLGSTNSGSTYLLVAINDSSGNKGPVGGFHNGGYRTSNTASANAVAEGDSFVFVMWNDGGDLKSRTNGEDNAENATGVGLSSFASGALRIGDTEGYTSPEYTGEISEILVFDGVLEEDEIEELEAYIIDRYGMDA